jgi:hypothetical protein
VNRRSAPRLSGSSRATSAERRRCSRRTTDRRPRGARHGHEGVRQCHPTTTIDSRGGERRHP